jgi:hypothetical protein
MGAFPRVNPGLCYFGHFGPQIGYVQMSKLQDKAGRLITVGKPQAGFSKSPGLFAVPRQSVFRSLLAWESARRTPSASKSLQ